MKSNTATKIIVYQKIYRSIFWFGIVLVLAAAFVPVKIDLHTKIVHFVSFELHADQILHSIVYLLICLYFITGQYLGFSLFDNRAGKKFLIVILVLSILTELVQLVIPSRAFNFFDLVANIAGIGAGLLIISLFGRRKEKGV